MGGGSVFHEDDDNKDDDRCMTPHGRLGPETKSRENKYALIQRKGPTVMSRDNVMPDPPPPQADPPHS